MQVQSIVQQLLEVVCPSMHRVRRASLVASVLGALRGRRLTVTAIGRALPGGTSQKHAIKRADRLLSNRHLHGQRVKHYQGLCRPLIGARTRPVLLVDWSDLDARKRHYLLRASVAVNGRSATVYEEVHRLASKDKRRTHQAFLQQLQAVLPVGCRPIIVTDAGFRTPWFQQVEALGWDWVGRIRNRHKMRWCSGGRWFDANRCYQQASSVANYLGQAVLTRSNPLVCQLVVYRGKAQGRKHYTCSGNVAQGRRSRVCAAREREPWVTGHLLAGHPHAGPAGRASVSVAHEHRGRLPGYEKPSVRPGSDLSPLRLGRTLTGIGVHRQSGFAGAVVSGDGHYRTGRPLSIPGQQCAPQTHSLSVVRGLANGPGYPHHPYSGGHEGRLVSTP